LQSNRIMQDLTPPPAFDPGLFNCDDFAVNDKCENSSLFIHKG
jgi:hypothetical protein